MSAPAGRSRSRPAKELRPADDEAHPDQALQDILAATQALLDALEIAVMVVAKDARIATVNREGERILRRTAAELQGLNVTVLSKVVTHVDGTPVAFEEYVFSEAMRSGRSTERFRRTLKLPDGTENAVSLWAQPLLRRGESDPIGVAVFLVDAELPVAHDDTRERLAALEAAFVKLAPQINDGPSTVQPESPDLALLTRRERQIVALLTSGLRVTNVAEELHLSRHTVRNHLKNVFRKLGVTTQAELIRRLRLTGPGAPNQTTE